jgi:long-subunit acyl-CoA synthetase (AMP-forming)
VSDLALAQPSLCGAFQVTAAAHADQPALRAFRGELALTWGEYAERVERIARGLWALGVRPGDTVALLLNNRPEFNLVDAAALHLGAVPFSLGHPATAEQTAYLIANAGPTLLITETALQGATDFAPVILVEALDDLPADPDFDFEATWRAVGWDDLATIVYTSGTTGVPKGVELAHRVILSSLRGVQGMAPVTPAHRTLAYLPTAHIAERFWSHYNAMAFGLEIVTVPDPGLLEQALVEERPQRFFGVPRIYEKLAVRAEGMSAAPEEIRTALGLDRASWLGVATAPSSPHVLELLDSVGLPVGDMWGMTEAVMTTMSPPGGTRPGTVGRHFPHVEMRVAADGELLIRGPNTFSGYRQDPEKTAETLDADGWVHSGDLGAVDANGYVRILGRKKDIMITSGGKNLAPTAIESALEGASPLIGYAATIADGRKFVTALIALDPVELRAFAGDGEFAELAASPEVAAAVEAAVERANRRLGKVEQVKRHRILTAPWAPGGDEVTTTLKLRRANIYEKFAREIDSLYD